MLFAFPAGTFQQAYGSSPQEKQPTEIRPAKTFHADKTLGKYLPVDHPGTAPDGRTDKAHPRPERHDQVILLARSIAKKIEDTLDYPGQIKVNVIRESRAVEYAK